MVLSLLVWAAVVEAAPVQIAHQGRLLGPSGEPVDGATPLQVALYDVASGGTPLWSESQVAQVQNGYYAVVLGANTASNPFDERLLVGGARYVEVTVAGLVTGPRQTLTSVPLAAHATSVQLRDNPDACTAARAGALRYRESTVQVCVPDAWVAVGGGFGKSVSNPGTSCAHIKSVAPSSANGNYWIAPAGNPAFEVYCDMTGGGWTLVVKVRSGDADTFRYDSANWTGTGTLNPTSLDPAVDENMKSLAYSQLPVSEIRFDLVTVGNSRTETVSAASLRAVLTGGFRASSYSRGQMLSWLSDVSASEFDNQPNCNVIGIQGSGPDPANCRYGIIMNNENTCSSADAAIGFGCHTNNYSPDGRWTGAGGHRWSPTTRYMRRGWIWVR
jgi:hypothetical protein